MEGLRECYLLSEKREVYNFLRCRTVKPFDGNSIMLHFEDGRHSVTLDVLMVRTFPERFADAGNEEWRAVVWNGTPTRYEVSSAGNVRWTDTRRLLRSDTSGGYRSVRIWVDGVNHHAQVSRLVAAAFIPNPEGLRFVRHKDGDPMHNAAENLEWSVCSRSFDERK